MTACDCADWPRIARVSSTHARSISFGGNSSAGIPWSMFTGLPPLENFFSHVCDNGEITSKTRGKNEEQASNVSSKLPRAAQLQTTREKKLGN